MTQCCSTCLTINERLVFVNGECLLILYNLLQSSSGFDNGDFSLITKVCVTCKQRLRRMCSFRSMALESMKYLRNMLEPVNQTQSTLPKLRILRVESLNETVNNSFANQPVWHDDPLKITIDIVKQENTAIEENTLIDNTKDDEETESATEGSSDGLDVNILTLRKFRKKSHLENRRNARTLADRKLANRNLVDISRETNADTKDWCLKYETMKDPNVNVSVHTHRDEVLKPIVKLSRLPEMITNTAIVIHPISDHTYIKNIMPVESSNLQTPVRASQVRKAVIDMGNESLLTPIRTSQVRKAVIETGNESLLTPIRSSKLRKAAIEKGIESFQTQIRASQPRKAATEKSNESLLTPIRSSEIREAAIEKGNESLQTPIRASHVRKAVIETCNELTPIRGSGLRKAAIEKDNESLETPIRASQVRKAAIEKGNESLLTPIRSSELKEAAIEKGNESLHTPMGASEVSKVAIDKTNITPYQEASASLTGPTNKRKRKSKNMKFSRSKKRNKLPEYYPEIPVVQTTAMQEQLQDSEHLELHTSRNIEKQVSGTILDQSTNNIKIAQSSTSNALDDISINKEFMDQLLNKTFLGQLISNNEVEQSTSKAIEERSIKKKQSKNAEHKQSEVTNEVPMAQKWYVRVWTEAELLAFMEAQRSLENFVTAKYKCVNCAIVFNDQVQVNDHFLGCHDEVIGAFSCFACSQRFPTKNDLDKHTSYHFTPVYICSVCEFLTHRKSIIQAHVCDPKDIKPPPKRSLRVHMECDTCGKIRRTRSGMIEHIGLYHDNLPEVECKICKEKCANIYKRNSHMRKIHRKKTLVKKEPRYYCVECDSTYINKTLLMYHLKYSRRHAREEDLKFACDQCDMRYCFETELTRHVNRVHLNLKPFKCSLCDRAFALKHALNKHIKISHEHMKLPKKYVCEVCGTGFTENSTLKDHKHRHTGERPYKCEICNATFGFSGALYTHKRLRHGQQKQVTKPRIPRSRNMAEKKGEAAEKQGVVPAQENDTAKLQDDVKEKPFYGYNVIEIKNI